MRYVTSIVIGICVMMSGLAAYAAAPDSLWMRAYGDGLNQECRCITQTSDGGYVFTGYTGISIPGIPIQTDVYVVRLDSDGDTLWTNHYGGLGNDVGYAIRQTSDGGFIVAGYYTYVDDPNNRDVYLVKLDSLGTAQWEKRYGHEGNDEAADVQVHVGDGGFLVAGYTQTPGPFDADVYLLRTDSNGDTLMTRQYDFTINDRGLSICETVNAYVVCGYVQPGSQYDVLLLKTDSHLDSLWTKTYGGPSNEVSYSLKLTPDLGFIVAGRRELPDLSVSNGWALRTDSSGDTLWTVTMWDSVYSNFMSVDVTSDGGYVFAGMHHSAPLADRDFYVVKLAGDGAVEWETDYGTSTEDVALSIEQIEGGDYIVAGHTGLSGSGNTDAFVVRTGGTGGVGPSDPGVGECGWVSAVRVHPNPSAGSAVVTFNLAVEGFISVAAYDVSGRQVANLFRGELPAGRQAFEWNGKAPAGLTAPPGVYFLRVTAGGGSAAGKLVLAR
jgi:hypothetical protein